MPKQGSDLAQPLLINDSLNASVLQCQETIVIATTHESKEKKKDPFAFKEIFKSIALSTGSFGIRSAIVGSQQIANGLILSSLGEDAAAAASVIVTVQSLTIGAISGFLASTGVELGRALGRNDQEAAYATAKIGMLMSLIFGMIEIGIFLSMRYTSSLILAPGVARAVADYFETFAIAAIPDSLIWNNGQIIYKVEKNVWLPLIMTTSYRIPGVALSYYLGKKLDLGPRGIGLGPAISGWVTLMLVQPWLSRVAYKDYQFYQLKINNFWKHFKTFLNSGWQLSLQRITEWGNLAIITQIIGSWSSQDLLAVLPSFANLTVCNSLTQGGAQASMMTASEDGSAREKALEDFKQTNNKELLAYIEKLIAKDYKHFYISSAACLILNAILAGALYFFKQKIIDIYIPGGTAASTLALANTLFWLNDLSLIPDTFRVILAGQLRGWGEVLAPALASLFIMSGLGILAGTLIGLHENKNILPLFIARAVALVCAAGFNYYRFHSHTQKDQQVLKSTVLLGEYYDALDAHKARKPSQIIIFGAEQLMQNAENYGMELQGIPGEGGNLLQTIIPTLGDDETYEKVRAKLAQHIKDNNPLYEELIAGDYKEFLSAIARGAPQVDKALILALSRALNVNIIMISSDQKEPIIIRQKEASQSIYLAYEVNSHYQLLTGNPSPALIAKLEATQVDDWNKKPLKPVQNAFYRHSRENGLNIVPVINAKA